MAKYFFKKNLISLVFYIRLMLICYNFPMEKKLFIRINDVNILDKLEALIALEGKTQQDTIVFCIEKTFSYYLKENPSKQEKIENYLKALASLREEEDNLIN